MIVEKASSDLELRDRNEARRIGLGFTASEIVRWGKGRWQPISATGIGIAAVASAARQPAATTPQTIAATSAGPGDFRGGSRTVIQRKLIQMIQSLDNKSREILLQFDKLVVNYAKSWLRAKNDERIVVKNALLEQVAPLLKQRWVFPLVIKNKISKEDEIILELDHVIQIPNTNCSWLLPNPKLVVKNDNKLPSETEVYLSGMVMPYKTISFADKEYEAAKAEKVSLEVEVFCMKGNKAVRQLILITQIKFEM